VLFNKQTEELLGVHIIGLHAADLIQECSNAMAAGSTVRELSYMVRPLLFGSLSLVKGPMADTRVVIIAGAHPPHAVRSFGRGLQGRRRPCGTLKQAGVVLLCLNNRGSQPSPADLMH
jgi:hypothetical protein